MSAAPPNLKPEFECLLGPGFHDLAPGDLRAIIRKHHPGNAHRRHLWDRYLAFLRRVQATGLACEVWVAGSFTTAKPDPGDIDTVLSATNPALLALSPEQLRAFIELFLPANKPIIKARYHLDAFFFAAEDEHQERYWMGQFGFYRSKKAKGIARFSLDPSTTL